MSARCQLICTGGPYASQAFVVTLRFSSLWFVLRLPAILSLSIYRLEIKQTSSGPLVVGMFFDRFEQPPMASCGTAHCFGGSHNPGECESLVIPVVHPQCAANPASCNYSVLEASKKGCSCLCTTYVGTCTGCSVGGYCTSPPASDWQRRPSISQSCLSDLDPQRGHT